MSQACFQAKKTVIDNRQRIKKLFPEYGCLLISPALFWSNNLDNLLYDENILQTISQYEGKPIETSQSVKGKHNNSVYPCMTIKRIYVSGQYDIKIPCPLTILIYWFGIYFVPTKYLLFAPKKGKLPFLIIVWKKQPLV